MLEEEKIYTDTRVQEQFASEFSKSFKTPVVSEEDQDRTLRAIMLLAEYIRECYYLDRSSNLQHRLKTMCERILSLENCNNDSICEMVCSTEKKLLNEACTHMINTNGIEMALCFKNSRFPSVISCADALMDECTASEVRSIYESEES